MSINKYRHVEDNAESSIYQCLYCYNYWSLFSSIENWKFCPYCGTQWEGEHKCLSPVDRYPSCKRLENHFLWIIQTCVTTKYILHKEWRNECVLSGFFSAKFVFHVLNEHKDDDTKYFIYRTRVITIRPDHPQWNDLKNQGNHYHSNPLWETK